VDQCLLRSATGARIPLDRALVDHDREGKTRVSLSFRHHQLCRLIDTVVRSVPIDDDAIDSTTDHVGNLAVDLLGVCRAVTHVHMIRSAEP